MIIEKSLKIENGESDTKGNLTAELKLITCDSRGGDCSDSYPSFVYMRSQCQWLEEDKTRCDGRTPSRRQLHT